MVDRAYLEQQVLLREELLRRRENDPWWAYEPTTAQTPFVRAVLEGNTEEAYMIAANRCLTPWTPVETDRGERQVVELLGETGFGVLSWDGGELCTRQAGPVFLKGIEPAFRLYLDNGEVLEVTRKHRVLTAAGWLSVGQLLSLPDARRSRQTREDSLASYDTANRPCDPQLHGHRDSVQAPTPLRDDAPKRSHLAYALVGVAEPTRERIRTCPELCPRATHDASARLVALCAQWKARVDVNCNLRCLGARPTLALSHVASYPSLPDVAASRALQRVAYHIPLIGGVRVTAWQQIGFQPILDFEVAASHNYRAGGIIHHNSGKSDGAAFIGAGLARFGRRNPRYQISHGGAVVVEDYATSGWVVSVDFPNSRDVIQPKYFNNGHIGGASHPPFIPEREIAGKFNVTDQILKMKNGSLIGFKSADTKAIKFAGADRDWVHIDEECPKSVYDEITIRIGAGRKLLVFGAMTLLPPEGQVGGVTWMYDEFIKPWQRDPSSCRFKLFRASIYDNPYLLPEEIRRLESKYPVGSAERAIRLDGEWMAGLTGTRAYGSFDARVHVRKQSEIILRRPLCWTLDFNVEPMIALIGQRDGRLFRVHRELVLSDSANIDDMVQLFWDAYPDHQGEVWVYGDATGRSRSGQTGRSYYQIIANHMRTYGCPMRLKVPEANPQVPNRINAVNVALRDEEGVSRIEIDPSCKELIDDLEQVLRDQRGGIKKSTDRKNPYFRRTHASDAFGYWINYEEPVRSNALRNIVNKIRNPTYAFGAR